MVSKIVVVFRFICKYIHFFPLWNFMKVIPTVYTSCSNYLITVILLIWRHWLSGWFPAIFFDHLINSTKKLKRKKNNNRRPRRKMSTNFVLSVIEFQINIRYCCELGFAQPVCVDSKFKRNSLVGGIHSYFDNMIKGSSVYKIIPCWYGKYCPVGR